MNINEKITVGRLGQQPMHIADTSVDPQHATLTRSEDGYYVLEDNNSNKGVFVFGVKIKRKKVKEETPFFLGSYKTTVKQLLRDPNDIDLQKIWADYDSEKRKWDRYSAIVNSIRVLTPVATMLVAQLIGQSILVSLIVLLVITGIAILAGEMVLKKKNVAMAELNAKMQQDYQCPHCHHFLGFTPYKILKANIYCPHCGVPIK